MRVVLDECLPKSLARAAQQDTKVLSFAVIVLKARSNKIEDLRPLVPKILAELTAAKPGQVAVVE